MCTECTLLSYLTTTLSNDEWFERIYRKSKSQSSVRSAKAALKTFQSFCLEKYAKDTQAVIQDLKTNPGDRVYIFLDKFVGFMNDKHPTTIRTYFGFIRSYLRTQGVKTNLEEIKDFVNFPKPEKERRKPLTKEIIRKLLDNSKEQRKVLYLTLLSSGMRIGEALALKKRDFDFSHDPVMISIPARYTKTKEARETFVSKEAKEIILRIAKRKNESDLIFTHQPRHEQALYNEEMAFGKLRRRCGLTEKYSGGKRYVVNIHAFRAYFHTKASKVHGQEYAHALDGHSSYLEQYYRNTIEERAEMYKVLEPELLIYEDSSSIQVKELEAKVTKLEEEKSKEQNEAVTNELKRQSQLIMNIQKELVEIKKPQK